MDNKVGTASPENNGIDVIFNCIKTYVIKMKILVISIFQQSNDFFFASCGYDWSSISVRI